MREPSRLSLMGTCFSVLIRMELARLRDQIILSWMYPFKAASAFPPWQTRRSYPKWVGVAFHLFRGAASFGRKTIHSPPSL